jgi:hypothetical protein
MLVTLTLKTTVAPGTTDWLSGFWMITGSMRMMSRAGAVVVEPMLSVTTQV